MCRNQLLSKISFENYEWPLLQIMGGFFTISLSGLFEIVLVGLFIKNTHIIIKFILMTFN